MEQPKTDKLQLAYTKYPLSRIVSVREIVSADYVRGNKLNVWQHVHQEAWELCFCIRGEVLYMQDGREFLLQAGQILFAAPGVMHASRITDPETASFYVAFTCTDTYIQILQQRVMQVTYTQERLLDRLIEELHSAFELKNDRLRIYNFVPDQNSLLGAEQMICCYMEQLLINILRELTMQDNRAVTGEKCQYYMVYSLNRELFRREMLEILQTESEDAPEQQRRDEEYRKKVLDSFIVNGKLVSIPAQRKKERIILEHIAESFESGRDYSEREVNIIIADFHDDFCTLRRDMIGEKLLSRENGVYRKI